MPIESDAKLRPNAQWRRLADAVLSTDPRRRIRIAQWLISVLVYLSTVLVLWFGILTEHQNRVLYWSCFVILGQAFFYVALRSGWSERFPDPALTSAQIVLGVVGLPDLWAHSYRRTSSATVDFHVWCLFPELAPDRASDRVRIGELDRHRCGPACVAGGGSGAWTFSDVELRLDATNLLMIMILLPALSLVAARLEEVERLATHDELTGLANRRHAHGQLAQEQQRFMRTKHPFSIAIIDIDNFKSINDRLGHAGGDDVLKEFSIAAATALRACDLLARWGGEEFLVLLPHTTGLQAQATLERVLERVRSLPQNAGSPLSFSAGVAEYVADEPLADTISRADHDMYRAKKCGRNRVLLAGSGSAL